ncbi:MAG: hypothetical protein WBH08_10565 [Methanothrix sp.]|uniref:hypothetical protein n=1 Tax=Methanothrix sp. TaxID=90426 RepID=UPI003C7552E3
MTKVLQEFTGQKLWICFLLASTLSAPAAGISVSCSSSAAGVEAVSMESFALDGSTSLHESLALGSGNIVIDRQAEGGGNNSLKQSLKGSDYVLQNNIESQGQFSASTASAATGQSAAILQNSAGTGSMVLEQRASMGIKDAGQEASVSGGTLRSAQSLSAGEQLSASQSTEIAGQEGRVLSGSMGEENVLLAEVGFSGMGTLSAHLTSRADETAHSEGYAAIDDTVLLNDGSFETVSREGSSRIMGMAGTRLTEGAGKSIGSFELQVMNLDRVERIEEGAGQVGTSAASSSGGSYSSYALTGCRWNERNPQLQLYLNPTGTPSGLSTEASQNAIAQAANTWDDAVGENLFADGSTVIVDYTKVVDNPFPPQGQEVADGYSVSGWKSLGDSYLGMQRWWSNGQLVNGYYSLMETDSWYNRDFGWTTDLATAQSTGRIDLQSVALHELGHGIGMGDLYTLPDGDPRQSDLQQVMNLYDGPQRELGNGDRTGVQILYNEPMNTNKIALQANNGQYVCAENGGGSNLVANRDWILAWETFRRIDLGNNKVALQAANGQYVCAENGGGSNLVANRDWILAWETFGIEELQ